MNIIKGFLILIVITVFALSAQAQTLQLTSTLPSVNTYNVLPSSNISVTFNQPVQVPAASDFYAYSERQGYISGTRTVSGNTLTFNPAQDLSKGDVVWVGVTKNLKTTGGSLLNNPTFFRFTVASSTSPSNPPVFKNNSIPYNTGNSAAWGINDFRTVDLDNDGDTDIITGFMWMENDGSGSFTFHPFDTQIYNFQLDVVDLDKDNHMDVLLATYYGIVWMKNNGDGTFTTKNIGGNIIGDMSIYDKNNDGNLDILYTDQTANGKSISWLIANGDETFTTEVVSTDSYCQGITAVDLNTDGLVDIVGGDGADLYWYRNDGSSYAKIVLNNTGSDYSQIAVEDLDSDGDLDILVGDYQKIVYLINNGNSVFTTTTFESSISSSGQTIFVIADYDGDQDLDIISNPDYETLTLYENKGNNTFTKNSVVSLNQQVTWGKPGDMDGDGDMDLVFTPYYGGLSWAKNTTLGEAIPFERDTIDNALPSNTDAAAWADYDNDGDQDVLVMGNIFTTLYQQTANGLKPAQQFTGMYGGNAQWFDYDNDGDADFLVNGSSSTDDGYNHAQTLIYINTNGVFNQLPSSTTLPGSFFGEVKAADLNNDGHHEIIVLGSQSGIFSELESGFQKVYELPSVFQDSKIAISDVDLDGDLDLAVSGWLGNDELGVLRTIYINTGNFTFTAMPGSFNGILSGNLLLNDFDNDGYPELAAIGQHRVDGYSYASSSFYKNTNGVFSKITPPETGGFIFVDNSGAANASDLNNDGYADVVTQYGSYYRGLNLYLNDKNGWFNQFTFTFPDVSQEADFITMVDYDSDQDLDFQSGKTIVRNNSDIKNKIPTAPTILMDSIRNNMLYTYWSGATDTETSVAALSYQIYIGSTTTTQNIVGSGADLTTGKQRIQKNGNAHKFWRTILPNGGDFYWGVQTKDAALGASPFSAKKTSHVIYIDGPARACTMISQKYKATPTGNYTWTIKGGHAISTSASEIEIVWDAEGYGSVSVTDGSHKNALDVRIVTKPTPAIQGSNAVCEETNNVYTVSLVSNHTYDWTINKGSLLGSSDSSKVFVKWGDHGSGDITMLETSAEGICVIENTMPVTINERPKPVIKGDSIVCWDNQDHHYEIQSVNGNAISWSVFGGVIKGSSSGDQLTVQWNDQGFGRVTVQESNAFCSTIERLEVNLLQLEQPDIQGNFVVCGTATPIIYTSASQPGYTYQWDVANGSIKGSSDLPVLSVNWDAQQTVGKIYLISSNGVCEARDSVYVTIYPAIAKPLITNNNGLLISTEAITYAWYFNNARLENATSQTYAPMVAGPYSVFITDSKGCTASSDIFNSLVLGVDDEIVPLKIYPNPVSEQLNVEFENSYRGNLNFSIYDVLGRIILKSSYVKDVDQFKQIINLPSITSGFIILEATGNNFYLKKKLATAH